MALLYAHCSSDNRGNDGIGKKDGHLDEDSRIDSIRVYKIDSLNNFYLIYGIKNGYRYKIVSRKDNRQNCNQILVSGYYGFKLSSLLYSKGDMQLAPGPVGCIGVDSTSRICLEDSIYDLYECRDIRGLCFE